MIPKGKSLGNCLTGALWLRWKFGGRLRGLLLQPHTPRHWVCVFPDGQVWHFGRVRNVFPWPFSILLFVGKYQRLDENRPNFGLDHLSDAVVEERI